MLCPKGLNHKEICESYVIKRTLRKIPFQDRKTSVKGLKLLYVKFSIEQFFLIPAFSVKGSDNSMNCWSYQILLCVMVFAGLSGIGSLMTLVGLPALQSKLGKPSW